MDGVLYESSLKYERWSKILLAFPPLLLVGMGILF